MRVLATSREPLGVPGEVCFRLPPLAVPGPDDDLESVSEREAVELFVARAACRIRTLLSAPKQPHRWRRLVRSLDGMPLAIELAAAQLDVLGLSQLVSGLDDRFRLLVSTERKAAGRQASLAATVEWKRSPARQPGAGRLPAPVDLPGPVHLRERQRCRRSRRGGRGGRPGSTVAADGSPARGSDGQFRYAMLETIRVYAAALLDKSGERNDIGKAVGGWTLREAQRAAASFEDPEDSFAGLWGDAERENVREVLAWALEHDGETALGLALAMGPRWSIRGHFGEGRAWLESAMLAAAPITDDVAASVAMWLARLAHDTGDFEAVVDHCSRAIELLAGRERVPGPDRQSQQLEPWPSSTSIIAKRARTRPCRPSSLRVASVIPLVRHAGCAVLGLSGAGWRGLCGRPVMGGGGFGNRYRPGAGPDAAVGGRRPGGRLGCHRRSGPG